MYIDNICVFIGIMLSKVCYDGTNTGVENIKNDTHINRCVQQHGQHALCFSDAWHSQKGIQNKN